MWTQRMLISVGMTSKEMGIDTSRAFDAIDIEKILDVLTSVVCETDDLRLVRILYTGAKIQFL